jgi:hypothetical protein
MTEEEKEWLRGDRWTDEQIKTIKENRMPLYGQKLDQLEAVDTGEIRKFTTGASRDTAEGKLDFEGFLSPKVLETFAIYMNKNRKMADGSLRDSDNWQKGIPRDVYMKSAWRHFFDMWKEHRGHSTADGMVAALCGLMFNVMGYLHELIKDTENAHEAEERGG